ncbi:hypothetical protein F511_44968 [Dorcoceras hygrometricum]|uniref:Mucin-2-like n=1 Tax=Dorcoceras hygrometricum TaxID=472368 RepID=A0A2Z6ZX61_9LAMI|nr:hypothetical protein F511_44968 [Dorcoceras hygrometricum]
MASSLISSSLHIAFGSVFDMDDAGLVQMFESFIATGLKEFLGCPAVLYEAALVEFFENGSVRDGMVVSTIGGTTVEISEEIFAATFELPMEGLTDLSEVPKDLVFDARSLFSESKEQILAETAKIGTDEDDQDAGTSDVGDKTAKTADGEKHWFDLSYEEIIVQITERPVVTPSDTDEEMGTIFGTDVDEAMSLDDILMTIPVEVPLPSAGVEITKITLGKDIKIPGVDERRWYMASLPQIPVDDKGKKPLLEKDPVKGNPVKELFLLIVADIDLLVQLMEQIIDDC